MLSLLNNGINPDTNNPLTLWPLCYSCVIPKTVYGSELWPGFSNSDMLRLERSHSFCVTFAQSYRQNTDIDFCVCTFGSVPLSNIIEYRKLVYLGQLCRLYSKYVAKTAFNLRLIRFLNYDKQTRGYIPEIYSLLSKYSLTFVVFCPLFVVVFESTKLTLYNR